MEVRPTIGVGDIRAAELQVDLAPVPRSSESELCRRQDALDQVGRDLATTALAAHDPIADLAGALAAAAGRLDIAPPDLARALLDRTLADPRFAEIPPRLALQAQLDVFAVAAGVSETTLWVTSRPGSVTCLSSSSRSVAPRRLKVLARTTIEDDAVTITGTRSPILGVPVRRNGASWGALAVRLHNLADRAWVEPLAELAARRVSAVLERQVLLEQGESRVRAAAATTERRLVRTGYDLHDGPLQALAVLADELRLVSADVGRLVPPECRDAVAQALADLHEQAASVEYQIREIAQSLETSAVARRPLTELLEREASIVSRRSGIEIVCDIRADLADLTDSQRIVLYRGVQEALSNVARHSAAGTATIRVRSERGGIAVTIRDDGCGFDSARVLPAAAKRGRLGLVGMAERAGCSAASSRCRVRHVRDEHQDRHTRVDAARRRVGRRSSLFVERVVDDAALVGEPDGFRAVRRVQLAVDVRQVELDRLLGDEELFADRLIREPAGECLNDPDLARRQAELVGRRRLAWRREADCVEDVSFHRLTEGRGRSTGLTLLITYALAPRASAVWITAGSAEADRMTTLTPDGRA